MELQIIQNKIYEIRGQKVMLDFDLAELYGTETRLLKRAVRRNMERFPDDFMFELTNEEANCLLSNRVSQIGIPQYNFSAYTPFAFTEQGVAMLSSVLHSTVAIKVNINIMRAFVMIRTLALTYKDLSGRLKVLEEKFPDIYKAINYLLDKDKNETKQKERTKIGFKK